MKSVNERTAEEIVKVNFISRIRECRFSLFTRWTPRGGRTIKSDRITSAECYFYVILTTNTIPTREREKNIAGYKPTTHSHVLGPDWILAQPHFPCSFECQTVTFALAKFVTEHECAFYLSSMSMGSGYDNAFGDWQKPCTNHQKNQIETNGERRTISGHLLRKICACYYLNNTR